MKKTIKQHNERLNKHKEKEAPEVSRLSTTALRAAHHTRHLHPLHRCRATHPPRHPPSHPPSHPPRHPPRHPRKQPLRPRSSAGEGRCARLPA